MKLGATGDYPEGKLGPDDEGGLIIGIARDHDGNVVVNFGKPVAWIAMPPDKAIALANMILQRAKENE